MAQSLTQALVPLALLSGGGFAAVAPTLLLVAMFTSLFATISQFAMLGLERSWRRDALGGAKAAPAVDGNALAVVVPKGDAPDAVLALPPCSELEMAFLPRAADSTDAVITPPPLQPQPHAVLQFPRGPASNVKAYDFDDDDIL